MAGLPGYLRTCQKLRKTPSRSRRNQLVTSFFSNVGSLSEVAKAAVPRNAVLGGQPLTDSHFLDLLERPRSLVVGGKETRPVPRERPSSPR